MERVLDLYPDTPPTVLRNREEKNRKAKNVPFWHAVADFVFFRMLQNRFYSLLLKNSDSLKKRNPKYATICFTPHCNWWDGIFAYYVTRKLIGGNFHLMIEEMNRFPLFQYIGCFPVNKKSAQTAIKSLKYACTFLNNPKSTFWIFPQGIIKPPFFRPIEFQTGLAYLIKYATENFGGINLVPISTAFLFLREDRPEIVAEFADPIIIEDDTLDRKKLNCEIEKNYEAFLDNHLKQISMGNFKEYTYLYKRKLSWWKVIEKKLKNIGLKNKIRKTN